MKVCSQINSVKEHFFEEHLVGVLQIWFCMYVFIYKVFNCLLESFQKSISRNFITLYFDFRSAYIKPLFLWPKSFFHQRWTLGLHCVLKIRHQVQTYQETFNHLYSTLRISYVLSKRSLLKKKMFFFILLLFFTFITTKDHGCLHVIDYALNRYKIIFNIFLLFV